MYSNPGTVSGKVAAEYEPLLVVTTEDRVKSHNHFNILEVRAEVVVESAQDRYIRVDWGNKTVLVVVG